MLKGVSLYKYKNVSITDRLHIGNRWLGHLGLAMYDNTARVHDPIVPHMLTCDSRAVDYPRHSPFSHCAGNPANMVDFDGNDVTVLDGGLHIALLVQQKMANMHIIQLTVIMFMYPESFLVEKHSIT